MNMMPVEIKLLKILVVNSTNSGFSRQGGGGREVLKKNNHEYSRFKLWKFFH